ncbi:unnamed protein product [Trichobilharzia szidati]|nr:unnamed protein product [Trichobilharzia szidati]
MTLLPQGNADNPKCNNNKVNETTSAISTHDYIINTSSIRLPFIAAGLVNAAVAELLNQLSCRFFEMAIITPKISDSEKESPVDAVQIQHTSEITNENKLASQNKTDQISTLQPVEVNESLFPESLSSPPIPQPPPPPAPVSSPTVSSSIPLFTNPNYHVEPMKIKEESEMDFPLDLNIEQSDPIDNANGSNSSNNNDDYSTLQQHVNNFLNDAMNEHYNQQQEHCQLQQTSQSSNLTHITTVDYLKRHPCTYRGCGKVFYSRTSLIYHKQSHAIDKPYMCTYPNCGMTFFNENLLKTHCQLHEPKQLRERFSCTMPGCNKVFVTRECLIEHIRVHTGERPFICDYPGCMHRFARRCNLFAHKRVHLDKNQRRQYHCIHAGCNKTFLYSRSLTEHMNVHLGERPYVCEYPGCKKSFTSKSYLYAHRRIHLTSVDKQSINNSPGTTITNSSTINNNHNNPSYESNNSNVPPIPVTMTIPVLQPIINYHHPFTQSIISNKHQQQQPTLQLQQQQQQQSHHQMLQQHQHQLQLQGQLQHHLLSNSSNNINNNNITMATNNIPAHLFYPNQHN